MNFEQEFRHSHGQPFMSGGVHYMLSYNMKAPMSGCLLIALRQSIRVPTQGVRIDCDVAMTLDDHSSQAFNIWADIDPRVLRVACQPSSEVMIRNIWDHGDGVVHSWHAGAAMHMETTPDGVITLYCNSTLENTHCRDLIVDVSSG